MTLRWINRSKAAAVGVGNSLVGESAVSHSECVMSAERLCEAARTGLGRSPPAGVCRLTDSSVLVYHTTAAAIVGGEEGVLSWQKHTRPLDPALHKTLLMF